jgi:histidinol phosphatase-like enzyme
MLLPHRHRAKLLQPLSLLPLPGSESWTGKIAYLDRDGVLNIGSPNYINCVEELIVLTDAAKSVGSLRRAGFRICVVTNQSPIGRGWWSHDTLAQIHDELIIRLGDEDDDAILDLILYSPYSPRDNSHARKGAPGMLEVGRQLIEYAERGRALTAELLRYDTTWDDSLYSSNDAQSVMVGDRDADMLAGAAYGVRTLRCQPSIGIADVIADIIR